VITEKDLQEAIAECEGQRNPTANTCLKLAAFYTIRDKMYPAEDVNIPRYSYAADKASYDSDTEFMQIARDIPIDKLFSVLDEIMSALSVLNPRLYQAAIRKLLEN
jgi:hypothetical protein